MATGEAGRAQTPDDWIKLGERVHDGFGAFIPVGIRIGQDALERLKAQPREVSVVYCDSDKAPRACVADGIMIATTATPGQCTLTIAAEKAPAGAMAVAVIRHRKTGAEVRYTVSEAWLPKLIAINKQFDPAGRYEQVMKAEGCSKFHSREARTADRARRLARDPQAAPSRRGRSAWIASTIPPGITASSGP
jgi:formylmethanofuran dehydrogenase subunit E